MLISYVCYVEIAMRTINICLAHATSRELFLMLAHLLLVSHGLICVLGGFSLSLRMELGPILPTCFLLLLSIIFGLNEIFVCIILGNSISRILLFEEFKKILEDVCTTVKLLTELPDLMSPFTALSINLMILCPL